MGIEFVVVMIVMDWCTDAWCYYVLFSGMLGWNVIYSWWLVLDKPHCGVLGSVYKR
jgi:hypothetical protein